MTIKVKPLEWEQVDGPLGRWWRCGNPFGGLQYEANSEAEKEEVFADHERRILSALETTPAPVSEITDEMVEQMTGWVRDDVLPAYGITLTSRASDPEMVEGCRAALTAALKE